MGMTIWQFNWSIQWTGNIQWALGSGAEPPAFPRTRIDVLARTDQALTWTPNTSVRWRGQADWMVVVDVGAPAPTLMGLERAMLRRIFGRIMGRVN